MNGRVIGLAGGIIMLVGVISPWLVVGGGENLPGFKISVFGSLFVITSVIAVLGIAVSIFGKKIKKALLPLGIISFAWGIYLFSQVKKIGIHYLGMSSGIEKALAPSLFGVSYGVHIIIIGGLLILVSGIMNLKDENGSK